MQMTFGGQSGNALAGAPPFLCLQSLSRAMLLPLLGKFWGREGRQSSLTWLGEHTGWEIVVVSFNPAGKTGRGLEQQLGCLRWGCWVMLRAPRDHWNNGGVVATSRALPSTC